MEREDVGVNPLGGGGDVGGKGGDNLVGDGEEELTVELDTTLLQEELLWLQRSSRDWQLYGDRNTKFYHQFVKQRSRRNHVVGLYNDIGEWIDDPVVLQDLARSYFESLYHAGPAPQGVFSAPNGFSSSESGGIALVMLPSRGKGGTSCLDGDASVESSGSRWLTCNVFSKVLEYSGDFVCRMVRRIVEGEVLSPGLNSTLVSLIPKEVSPETVKQFRPISLCNVLYKIATKLMVNRMKPLLA